MNGRPIEIVNSYKYLGCINILSSDSNDSLDIDRCKNVFNRQFGFTYRKFYSVNKDVFYSLFLSFCGSFNGSELWMRTRKSRCAFNKMCVSYHSALRKILGVRRYFSNHLVYSILQTFTFEHLLNAKMTRFMFWLKKCNSVCFVHFKFYFMNRSIYCEYFSKLWSDKYGLKNVFDNDFDALLARIKFLQDREPTSMFVGF